MSNNNFDNVDNVDDVVCFVPRRQRRQRKARKQEEKKCGLDFNDLQAIELEAKDNEILNEILQEKKENNADKFEILKTLQTDIDELFYKRILKKYGTKKSNFTKLNKMKIRKIENEELENVYWYLERQTHITFETDKKNFELIENEKDRRGL